MTATRLHTNEYKCRQRQPEKQKQTFIQTLACFLATKSREPQKNK